jgi:hypothetical protein
MTTPWSCGKIFWTPTVPQPFNARVVGVHATVPKGPVRVLRQGETDTIMHLKLCMLRYYLLCYTIYFVTLLLFRLK